MIPIKDAWFQLINNQVISLDHVKEAAAADCEVRVFETLSSARTKVLESLKYELYSPTPAALCDLPEDMRDYMAYAVSFLSSDEVGILKAEEIDKTDNAYVSWKEKSASLREYLYAGIYGGWIHTEALPLDNKYLNLDAAYEELTRYILASLEEDRGFEKKLYKHLIDEGAITGCDLMLILYTQGLLTYNEQEIQMLETGNEDYAFKLIKDKISCLELTPAQMALEPCTAGVVVTDVTTGKVLALVTYPGYDSNRLSGTMDAAYYRQLLNGMSNPLYNKATQVLKAPASTFKPVMAAAALEEGVVSLDETVTCSGLYNKVAVPIKCWVYPGRHGAETITEAIQNSCNYYFAKLAARLSTDASHTYDSEQGIRMIQKYAGFFGWTTLRGWKSRKHLPTWPQRTRSAPPWGRLTMLTQIFSFLAM